MNWMRILRVAIGAALTGVSTLFAEPAVAAVVAAVGGAVGGRDVVTVARGLIDATRRRAGGGQ